MAIINGLIVAMFLILVVASVAVVGSMIVLTLFDLALSRKRPSGTTAVLDSDPEITNRSRLVLAALAIQKNTREVADHFKWLRERQEAQSQAAKRRAGTTKA
jgi:hypothetical protein